jgi:hypothetical protein
MDIKRSDAAKLLDAIRVLVAQTKSGERTQPNLVSELDVRLQLLGLQLPKQCPGDAHSNPHFDNCSLCAPHWGWIFEKTKVR